MNTIEHKFRDEIEVEGMWVTIEQGQYVFFSMLQVSLLLVFGLWDIVPHKLLVIWVSLLSGINFSRWMVMRFYYTHKNTLAANIRQFKRIILFVAVLSGFCWGMGIIKFMVPSQPASVLVISIALVIDVVGAMLIWFCYLPAVIVNSFPAAMPLVILLFLQGGKTYVATSLLLSLLTIFGVISSRKLTGMLNYALLLNFENAALRQESEEKSKLLGKSLVDAEQANAAKTRFLAAASHDLRQPIHALGLFFAELSDRVYSPETALVIGQVEDSIAAINSMLNALLDVSKLDAGIVKPTVEPVALSDLFARLQTEFQPIALENQNELHVRPTAAIVDTDPAMLERMLRNLIGNALRYTGNGRIVVAARPRGQEIEIQVLDTGSGIPDDQLEEIFVEFHQLQNPARDRRQGLGLGLAIVKRLARLLRHEIKVTSRLGQGSCFSITLPLAHEAADSVSGPLTEKASLLNDSLAGHQVLVLDDDIAVLEGMRGLLTRWGCQVITAGSPTEAENKLVGATQKLDLLVVDYRLPDHVSGIEVAGTLQNRLGYPVAVLIITGDTGPERLQEADASGYPLLHKPVQPAKLRSTLQYLLSKRGVDKP
jgi:signal transduction histidine kinase